MKYRLVFPVFSLFVNFAGFLYAQNIIITDSTGRIDSCIGLSKELKVFSETASKKEGVKILEYKKLYTSLAEAQEKFFRLEIHDSDRILENIITDLSDAVVFGGSPEDIYNIFGQVISHKLLIHLSKKEESRAKELLKEYIYLYGPFKSDSKKVHPALRNFLSANLEAVKGTSAAGKEVAALLQKAFPPGINILFDGYTSVPDTIVRGKHILIIENDSNYYRVLIKNFEDELTSPVFLGNYSKNRVYMVLSEDGFVKAKNLNAGKEMVFCRESGSGLITGEGKVLSKEEALGRNIKVEIIKAEEAGKKEDKGNGWWLYAAGGTVAAAIITSIIIISSGDKGTETFKDKIQVK